MLYIELPESATIKTDEEGYCIIEIDGVSQIKAAEVIQNHLNGCASSIPTYARCPNEDKTYLEYLDNFVTKDVIEKPSSYWTIVNGKEKNAFLNRVTSNLPWHTITFLDETRRRKIEEDRAETRNDRRTKGPKSV